MSDQRTKMDIAMSKTIISKNELTAEFFKKILNDFDRVILVGPGASGKDYARKIFECNGFSYGISYTTRAIRDDETAGTDYKFISDEQFKQMINDNLFYEHNSFNGWLYGRTFDDFYDSNLLIMTPSVLKRLQEDDRLHSYVIYFDIDENTRRERLCERKSSSDSIERRIMADEEDFKNFTDYNLLVTNPFFF